MGDLIAQELLLGSMASTGELEDVVIPWHVKDPSWFSFPSNCNFNTISCPNLDIQLQESCLEDYLSYTEASSPNLPEDVNTHYIAAAPADSAHPISTLYRSQTETQKDYAALGCHPHSKWQTTSEISRQRRREQNRAAQQACRAKKTQYEIELRNRCKTLEATNIDLLRQNKELKNSLEEQKKEIAWLLQQLKENHQRRYARQGTKTTHPNTDNSPRNQTGRNHTTRAEWPC